ncbi:C40 family peptidase [Candidatus Chloroploca sp. Khr17]|uniref:C40 family peptidase n=1 Tax=Candidatus Chloroploca sp. Khr17 TaxID=2496869 RepID=UPI0013EDC145|nr:C40 family peptidase [Candidatus Chloroploca sp. Khr17]
MIIRAMLILLVLLVLVAVPPAPASAAPVTQAGDACAIAVNAALTRQGYPYVWGAKGPSSFDCSGLTYWAYAQAGLNIGISTYDQQSAGVKIDCTLADLNGAATSCWQPGDLAFLRYAGGQHVALYAGSGLFIDAYNTTTGVILHNPASSSFYAANWWQSRRPASCAGSPIDPGMPYYLPDSATPQLESIANVMSPISLMLPWQCGYCSTTATHQIADLTPMEYPESDGMLDVLYPFRWFGVFLWNEAVRPIICWLLTIAQGILNALAYAFNAVIVAGVNLFWKLGVLALLWIRDMYLGVWGVIAWVRLLLWSWWGEFLQVEHWINMIRLFLADLGYLLSQVMRDIAAMVMSLLEIIWWFVGLFMTLITGMVTAVMNPAMPTQYEEINNFFLWVWFVDLFRAVADSSLWWAWTSFVALIYLRFVLWLSDRLSQLNS